MVSPELVATLNEARCRTPHDSWQQLAARLAALDGYPDKASRAKALIGLLNPDASWLLTDAFAKHSTASWREIAAAMSTLDHVVGDAASLMQIIWTGPANGRFPVRRLDQVLYDLVSTAKRRIVLVTFAAHRVPRLCTHLTQAVERGVELTLILESENESEGQLTFDALAAFKNVPAVRMHIYYWPVAKRERNQAGRPGKLHAKCAMVDDVALIGSANLTDDAFNRNMELGVLVREPATVSSIADHFQELIRRSVLVELQHSNP